MAYRQMHHPPAVTLNEHGAPEALMGSGHHFREAPGGNGRRPSAEGGGARCHGDASVTGGRPVAEGADTPMCAMLQQVADLDLRRPDILD